MLLVDRLASGEEHQHETVVDLSKPRTSHSTSRNRAASIGLMTHAAIDGVALGATVYAGHSRTTSTIFMAIMLHKV